jgi:hypothetical protein
MVARTSSGGCFIDFFVDYELLCFIDNVEHTCVRLHKLSRSVYLRTGRPDDCLNKLIPAERPTNST